MPHSRDGQYADEVVHPPLEGNGTGSAGDTLTIDCDRCALRAGTACEDCVVTFLLDREPDDAVVIDATEARAMRMLGQAGLVPRLRYRARVG